MPTSRSTTTPASARNRQRTRLLRPEETGGQALVDGGEQHEHHVAAYVQPPVRDRPVALGLARLELVRLAVAGAVDVLADAGHEERRRSTQPGVEAGGY